MKIRRIAKAGWVLVIIAVLLFGFIFISGLNADAALEGGIYNLDSDVGAEECAGNADVTSVSGGGGYTIGASAFKGCPNLSQVNISGAVTIEPGAFMNCPSLASVSIGGGASIADGAFSGCENLSNVSISGDAKIGSAAFSGCTSLGSFSASTISALSPDSFYSCPLKSCSVGSSSPYTFDGAGGVYKDGGSTLVMLLNATNPFIVGSEVRNIAGGAFSGSDIDKVIFESPNSIEHIGNQQGWDQNPYITAIGADNDGEIARFFEDEFPTYGYLATVDYDGSGAPVNCKITVEEQFYTKDGATLVGKRNNDALSGNYVKDDTITAQNYSDYEFVSGNSPYTVKKTETLVFKYNATVDDPVVPGETKTYTVSVYNEFYNVNGEFENKALAYQEKYEKGSSYSLTAQNFENYNLFDQVNTSSSAITSDVVATFKYKAIKKDDPKPDPGPTPKPDPTPDPKPDPTPKPNPKKESSGGGAASTPVTSTPATDPAVIPGTPFVYEIIEGANQSVPADYGIVSMRCNGELEKFKYVMMDGKEVQKECYATASGSTILAFTAEYVKALSEARHHIRFVYTDGYADTTLTIGNPPVPAAASSSTVVRKSGGSSGKSTTTVTYTVSSDGTVTKGHVKDETPKTADGFDERYLLCLAILFCGIGAIFFSKTRKIEIISSRLDD